MLVTFIVIFFSILTFWLLLRLYCKLTIGTCTCQQDMTGKTVLITGASSGIGKETAIALARRNARVILACRNLKKAENVKSEIISITGNSNLEVKHLELESFESVRRCAEDILRTEKRLDVLINNAATVADTAELTKDGYEKCIQANHLSHFLLTILLLDLLRRSKPSRIINVASIGYLLAVLDLEDMDGSKHSWILGHYGNFYYRTKLANILFTMELARRLEGTGVTANVLHPGLVKTPMLYLDEHPVLILIRYLINFLGKSAEEGAQTTIHLAVDPDLEKTSGKYFFDCQERFLIGKAKNRAMARKLFEISEKVVGESYKD